MGAWPCARVRGPAREYVALRAPVEYSLRPRSAPEPECAGARMWTGAAESEAGGRGRGRSDVDSGCGRARASRLITGAGPRMGIRDAARSPVPAATASVAGGSGTATHRKCQPTVSPGDRHFHICWRDPPQRVANRKMQQIVADLRKQQIVAYPGMQHCAEGVDRGDDAHPGVGSARNAEDADGPSMRLTLDAANPRCG